MLIAVRVLHRFFEGSFELDMRAVPLRKLAFNEGLAVGCHLLASALSHLGLELYVKGLRFRPHARVFGLGHHHHLVILDASFKRKRVVVLQVSSLRHVYGVQFCRKVFSRQKSLKVPHLVTGIGKFAVVPGNMNSCEHLFLVGEVAAPLFLLGMLRLLSAFCCGDLRVA